MAKKLHLHRYSSINLLPRPALPGVHYHADRDDGRLVVDYKLGELQASSLLHGEALDLRGRVSQCFSACHFPLPCTYAIVPRVRAGSGIIRLRQALGLCNDNTADEHGV